MAYRISLLSPITFSMSFNDYGFELLSDQAFEREDFMDNNLLTPEHLLDDLEKSINVSEMARRRFRDIAVISGLVFQGFPTNPLKPNTCKVDRSCSSTFLKITNPIIYFTNKLWRKPLITGWNACMTQVFENIQKQTIVWRECSQPTPFSFPLITDRIRAKLSSESVEDRIKKMYLQLEKAGQ